MTMVLLYSPRQRGGLDVKILSGLTAPEFNGRLDI